MPLAGLLLAILAQSSSMEEILRKWSEDNPSVRDDASREALRLWKIWGMGDLERLAGAARGPESEISARARAVQAEILFRRQFGEKGWAKVEEAQGILSRLRSGRERTKLVGWSIPGGPMFDSPPAVKELVSLGPEIEPYLRRQLDEPGIRSEVALVLSEIGGVDTLPELIRVIPPADGVQYTSVVYALWALTSQSIGIHSRMEVGWSPQVPAQWRRWHDDHKDFLYGTGGKISLDVEAWTVGKPSKAYRKDHPWISYEQIRHPEEGPEYEARLREYCVSFLLRSLWKWGRFDDDALWVLGDVGDPRALAAIRRLAREPQEEPVWVAWALSKKAPETIPDLENLLATTKVEQARHVRIPLAWSKLRKKLGPRSVSPEADGDDAVLLLECLEGNRAIPQLLDKLKGPEPTEGILEIAGFVRSDEVADALRRVQEDRTGDPLRRLQAAVALGRSGDPSSLEVLRRGLRDEKPHLRLVAAEGLWRLSNREGFQTLISLLDLRPLQDGRTASSGARCYAQPERTSNLHAVRRSCELLGEMGDPAAIDPLKKILEENLNGFLGLPEVGTGTGWYGRPDVVALARLGNLSGIEVLLASLRRGDPLGVGGDRSRTGDLVEIGLKRYAKELVPSLAVSGHDGTDLGAARAILMLLDRGK